MNGLDELIRFLRARYDEDEAALDEDGHAPEGAMRFVDADRWSEPVISQFTDEDRIRQGIAGKRRIVDMAEQQDGYHLPEGVNDGRDPDERLRDEGMQVMLTEVLHHLAEEFAAHPEYN